MRDPNAVTLVNTKLVDEMRARRNIKAQAAQKAPELSVTLWPSFPHFSRFANDRRITGIRLNSAMMSNPELDKELELVKQLRPTNDLFFDVKGRQLRVTEVVPDKDCLKIKLNHPVEVKTPCVVLFKAGADQALLNHIDPDGTLVFDGGPRWRVSPGESLHIRDKSLSIKGNIFTPLELQKIEKVRAAGFKKYFLSYVEKQSDIDEFQELVGKDSEIWLKIESLEGMRFVVHDFKKRDNLVLVAARGDLFVELDQPHHMIDALRVIIKNDPEACVGSRILLSVISDPVPSCADLLEIAWLHDIGYNRMMLCDELCLKENLLSSAVAVFDGIKHEL